MKFYNYDDIEDEIPDDIYYRMEDDGYGPEDRIELDDPEEVDDEPQFKPRSLVSLLRSELTKNYNDRMIIPFRCNGRSYEGVTVLEIPPKKMGDTLKFTFEIGKNENGQKLIKTFAISDIVLE